MFDAIALLRSTAEECGRRARDPVGAAIARAELMDLAAKWHWLAGEVAALCRKRKELIGGENAACALCRERCAG